NGRLHEAAQGMYLVPDGKATILTTQMEPADCRRMFPCWDEPAYRATFELTVTVPENWLAVSNMPGTETPAGPGNKQVHFAATPPMASYLVALVAGHLDTLSDTAGTLPIRVVTAPGKAKQGAYALHVLKQILPWYGDFFGVKYPLPKLDLIALPNSHNGAMENWGCITFDESELLFDPQQSSHDVEQDVYSTVSHEVAHQWFGDLVTMEWWDDLWLNEAFANFMSDTVTDRFNPAWEVWLSSSRARAAAMSLDALPATHPIHQAIHSPAEADSAFDEITYDKGEAVLRMIASWLGADNFRDGLRRYFKAHAFGNSVERDLWQALGGDRVRELATTWVNQPGFPEVRVHQAAVEQRRFNAPDSPQLW
ncbi:MAG: M1 family metallopeptidase, partial [Candidatus Xenobia bacterium]